MAVIDVDLNNDDDLNDAGEDGYYLVFPDGVPPAGVNYTVNGIVENDDFVPHADLGATIVCFTEGTMIETEHGPRAIETLQQGDRVLTRDDGYQPLRWIGTRRVRAEGDLAPVLFQPGTVGNDRPLLVRYQGEYYTPIFNLYTERDFGGFFPTEANYLSVQVELSLIHI